MYKIANVYAFVKIWNYMYSWLYSCYKATWISQNRRNISEARKNTILHPPRQHIHQYVYMNIICMLFHLYFALIFWIDLLHLHNQSMCERVSRVSSQIVETSIEGKPHTSADAIKVYSIQVMVRSAGHDVCGI